MDVSSWPSKGLGLVPGFDLKLMCGNPALILVSFLLDDAEAVLSALKGLCLEYSICLKILMIQADVD